MHPELKAIAKLPFNGDLRKGPRHRYIVSKLLKAGCQPMIDSHGNIWVERWAISQESDPEDRPAHPTIVVSSHMDVDPRVRDLSFSNYNEKRKRMVSGVLDNSVGCYLNLLLAASRPASGRVIHVFTASEEVERDNPRRFCRSAREAVRELRASSTKPDFCAVIDVTFPRLLQDINWSKPYSEVFDVHDRTRCFIDGYSRRSEKRLVLSLLERIKDPHVGVRYLHGHDEAFVYSRLCPSFAFGPVVYGDFSAPGQQMPLCNLETALSFLRRSLGYRE